MRSSVVIFNSAREALNSEGEITVSAIVLRARPYRDSDLMAQILTPNLGKLSVIGRHARGSKKRFPSSLDIFDRGSARISLERRGALSIKEFTPAHSLVRLREDLNKLTLASLLCESFDLVIHENSGEDTYPKLFEVLDLALNAIEEAAELRPALKATLLALSSLVSLEGIADVSSHTPGTRMLDYVLNAIENFSERQLVTREAIGLVIRKLGTTQQTQ